jgi:hypothetical protein
MTEFHTELLAIADQLEQLASRGDAPVIMEPLEALKEAANTVGKAWGGSWMGYHANVYYSGLKPPPPGAHFSQEWGLMRTVADLGSHGDWFEYDSDVVKEQIYKSASNPDLGPVQELADKTAPKFEENKSDLLSILETELATSNDPFLARLKEETEALSLQSPSAVAQSLSPNRQIMTRDTVVLGQGTRVPPHFSVLSDVISLGRTIGSVRQLGGLARKAGSHLKRKSRQMLKSETIGTNVFIGHGQSKVWKDLKDFIQDRIKLPWDEFNRVPVAGVTNTARLLEMLDSSAIAFLVMTAEDEQKDGKLHARMNVVHEVGLFQGRLGFTRAILVLEDGCEEFSNIEGLGQIRFPKGNIEAAFEEIRRVLERENIIEPD